MRIKNDLNHYGIVAICLHWLIALFIITLLGVGLYMTDLPKGPFKNTLYGLHKSFGITVLTLVIIRIIWRLINVTPALLLPLWEKWTARLSHWLLYILMVAMPLSGWLMTSAAGYTISFFGLFNLPSLIAPNDEYRHFFRVSHTWIAYGLIFLISIHFLGALKHYFIDKDNILRRMMTSK